MARAKTAFRPRAVPAPRAGGRLSGKGVCQSRRGGALIRPQLWRGSAKERVLRLHDRAGNRGPAGAVPGRGVSSDQNGGLFGTTRRLFESLLSSVIENQFNRCRQAIEAFRSEEHTSELQSLRHLV